MTRDRAGELGITEWDEARAAAEVTPKPAREHVANRVEEFAPDLRGRMYVAGVFARVVALVFVVGSLVGLGLCFGWALWGQP